MKPVVLFIVGPTATGKSEIAIRLARKFNGEIISADSMLVYRGMDIGTAKPSQAEREKTPHHLIDIVSPSRKYSVYQYFKKSRRVIAQILKRGKLPVVVGGTGFYVRALLKGLEPLPPANLKLRRVLSRKAEKPEGLKKLYIRLKKIAPERAAKIDPADARRIIRALEIAAWKPRLKQNARVQTLLDLGYGPVVIGISRQRELLYADINERVDSMFRCGLVDEVKELIKGSLSPTATQAVGYKEVIGALKGEYSMEKAKELVKRNTRHLAKRQWTWFKREEGLQWIQRESGESCLDTAKRISSILSNHVGFMCLRGEKSERKKI